MSKYSVGSIFNMGRYGDAEILENMDSRRVKIMFLETSYICICQKSKLLNKSVKDKLYPSLFGVGIIGENGYKGNEKASSIWKNMIRRCYSGEFPSYSNTIVSDEWLYFPNFVEWFNENYKEGYELDKDLIGDGLLYSKDTSIFIPRRINRYIEGNKKNHKGYCISGGYISSVGRDFQTGKKVHLGYSKTIDSAIEKTRKFKAIQNKSAREYMRLLNFSEDIISNIK